MAHKKGVGSTDNGRDSNSKRLGVKLFGGQTAIPGNIIIRQRGTKFHPGIGVGMGKDFTIYSKVEGRVTFTKKRKNRTYVNVLTQEEMKWMLEKRQDEESVQKLKAEVNGASKSNGKKAEAKAAPKPAEKKADTESAADPKPEKAKAPKKPVEQEKQPEAKSEAAPSESRDENLKNLLSTVGESKGQKDDLKKISGVGPKLEGMLHDLGIHSFEQVSKFTEKEYTLIDNLLGAFQGRAKRDEWAKQAAELMKAGPAQDDNPFGKGPEDLKIVEGIGPKIEELLKADGIKNWKDLADAEVSRLQEILDNAGSAYKIHSPNTWPHQAGLAHDKKWDELQKLQDELIGGKEG